ncbi:MAG: LPP20 family lipoprotein [Desulfuromonadales bacterium]
MRGFRWFLLVMLLPALLAGCSGKNKLVAGAPDWVNSGSGAFDADDARVFYGVGAVTGITSPSLAVQAADQRARADIAGQLETYVANLFRDYQASTTATTGNQTVEEQHIEGNLKSLTQVSVRGARVIEHWRNPENNTIYALARLDLEGFAATLEQMQEMDPTLKTFVRSNAEKAFDELRQEEKGR